MGVKSKLNEVEVSVFREDDGSYAAACSALGVYTVGKTIAELKRNFSEALDLHLDAIRANAQKALVQKISA